MARLMKKTSWRMVRWFKRLSDQRDPAVAGMTSNIAACNFSLPGALFDRPHLFQRAVPRRTARLFYSAIGRWSEPRPFAAFLNTISSGITASVAIISSL